jgi:hypothetical protein
MIQYFGHCVNVGLNIELLVRLTKHLGIATIDLNSQSLQYIMPKEIHLRYFKGPTCYGCKFEICCSSLDNVNEVRPLSKFLDSC